MPTEVSLFFSTERYRLASVMLGGKGQLCFGPLRLRENSFLIASYISTFGLK